MEQSVRELLQTCDQVVATVYLHDTHAIIDRFECYRRGSRVPIMRIDIYDESTSMTGALKLVERIVSANLPNDVIMEKWRSKVVHYGSDGELTIEFMCKVYLPIAPTIFVSWDEFTL